MLSLQHTSHSPHSHNSPSQRPNAWPLPHPSGDHTHTGWLLSLALTTKRGSANSPARHPNISLSLSPHTASLIQPTSTYHSLITQRVLLGSVGSSQRRSAPLFSCVVRLVHSTRWAVGGQLLRNCVWDSSKLMSKARLNRQVLQAVRPTP